MRRSAAATRLAVIAGDGIGYLPRLDLIDKLTVRKERLA